MEVSKLELRSPSATFNDFHVPTKTGGEISSIYTRGMGKISFGAQNLDTLSVKRSEGSTLRYSPRDKGFSFLTDLSLAVKVPLLEVKDK